MELKSTKPRTLAEQTRLRSVVAAHYVEIGQHNVLVPYRDKDGTPALKITEGFLKLSPEAKKIIDIGDKLSYLMKLEIYVASRIYGDGPKVFRPTAEQLFALEKMKLNIEMRDFYSPFETIVVELPEEYSKVRTHKDERALNYSVFIFDKKQNFLLHDVIYDEHALKSYWMPESEEEVLESWFSASTDKDEPEDVDLIPGDILTTWAEYKLERLVRRAVCNYCLLLDEVGTKIIGPAVPNQYSQLVKWSKKNNAFTRKNKLDLIAQPIIHGLKAVPTPLVRHIIAGKPMIPFGKSGKVMPYHMRRGHYKMQPYGPQGSLRKRIRIPALIINAHLAPGLGLPSTQEYKT